MHTHVLIVEDNPSDWYLWKELLAEPGNKLVTYWAKDGIEAMDFIGQRHVHKEDALPDVILLDLSMPRIDGYQLLQLLKNDRRAAHIPVIVLTTSSSQHDREQCAELGAAHYYTKPSGISECVELAAQLMEKDFPQLVKH